MNLVNGSEKCVHRILYLYFYFYLFFILYFISIGKISSLGYTGSSDKKFTYDIKILQNVCKSYYVKNCFVFNLE